jgi:hypothetical protein
LCTTFPVLVSIPFRKTAHAHASGRATRVRSPSAASMAARTPRAWSATTSGFDGIVGMSSMNEIGRKSSRG